MTVSRWRATKAKRFMLTAMRLSRLFGAVQSLGQSCRRNYSCFWRYPNFFKTQCIWWVEESSLLLSLRSILFLSVAMSTIKRLQCSREAASIPNTSSVYSTISIELRIVTDREAQVIPSTVLTMVTWPTIAYAQFLLRTILLWLILNGVQ